MPTETAIAIAGIDEQEPGFEEFLELETKIGQVAHALDQMRRERDQAVAALNAIQTSQEKLQRAQTQAEQELVSLRRERNEVKHRVSKLLQTVRKLEAAGA